MIIKKGDIVITTIKSNGGSAQNGLRPVMIIQNDTGNNQSGTTIVAAITSKNKRVFFPTHVKIKEADGTGLKEDSVVMLEQIFTIDKKTIMKKIGVANDKILKEIDEAILRSFGIKLENE